MKKILILIVLVIVVLYAALNHKFLLAITYLYDNDFSNDSKAINLLKDATYNDGDIKSTFLLGYYYKTQKFKAINLKKSHKYYLMAANRGDNKAKMLVAWNFYKGIGCIKNLNKAKELLTELAINGNSDAKEILKFVMRN